MVNDKKQQIIDAAIRLMSAEGVGVATAKIAKEAEVSNGTLFNYFATKQDLIDAVYLSIKANMANDVIAEVDFSKDSQRVLLQVWQAYANWCIANHLQDRVMALLKSSQLLTEETKQAGQELWQFLFELIEADIKAGKLIDCPPIYLCEVMASQLAATIAYAIAHQHSKKALAALIELSFSIYWKGISK